MSLYSYLYFYFLYLFENLPVLPLLIKLAALGNLKVNFHCAHWHSFFPLKKGLSKTHQSSLTLKGGSTAFPKPLSPQGTGDVPTALLGAQTATLYGWRTIRGLRQQQSCGFLCGDKPAFTQGFAKGLFAHCFFRKPTSPPLTLSFF